MTEPYEIHQFEYRWQPNKDMSLIAGSMPASAIQPWSDRIALWVRHRAVKAPTESVRYEIFEDGMAALAWRQRNAQATEFGTESRPEASRVLMASVDVLTPLAAVAVCHAGLPEAIGPRCGQVAVNSDLPALDPDVLIRLVRDQAGELDHLAVKEPGLYRVIAAALTDPDTPLAVQLPQRVIAQRPQNGSQARLLWGLMRTVWPLLGSDFGRRDWSFATYEPPQGDVDTGALPDIVFRLQQPVQPALSMRREILVRPQEPTEPPASIQYQDFARLLVDAYQHMGGDDLGRHIHLVGGEYPSLDTRITGVQETLCNVLPAEALSVASQQYVNVTGPALPEGEGLPLAEDLAPAQDAASPGNADWLQDAAAVSDAGWPQDPASAGEIGWPQDAVLSESIPPAAPAPAAPYFDPVAQPLSAAPPTAEPRPSIWAQAPAASLGTSHRAEEDAPPRPGSASRPPATPPWLSTTPSPPPTTASPSSAAGGRREQADMATPYTVSGLISQLDAGPGDPGFQSALQFLQVGQFPDQPADRAIARQLIADRDWYIPVLLQYDSAHVDDTLEVIFRAAVIPDLHRPEVTAELARWAGERTAPPPVIKALNAAAQGQADGPEMMARAVELPLGRRWLTEHGIYTGPSGYTPAGHAAPGRVTAPAPRGQGTQAPASHRSLWASLDGRLRGDPVTLLLAVFCVILILLLALR